MNRQNKQVKDLKAGDRLITPSGIRKIMFVFEMPDGSFKFDVRSIGWQSMPAETWVKVVSK